MSLRIAAVIAVRNGELYIGTCLEYLKAQGIEVYLINHDSSDGTRQIAERFAPACVRSIIDLDYSGAFDLAAMLKIKAEIIAGITVDWVIHQDVDEILEAPIPFSSLRDGITAADEKGFNVINFDEFVFVPSSEEESFEGSDYTKKMNRYYFFEPQPLRLNRCWRVGSALSNIENAGHILKGDGMSLFPINFVLRHYIILSGQHGRSKYGQQRNYSDAGVSRGWHGWRAKFADYEVRLPSGKDLKTYMSDGVWDKSEPKTTHQFIVPHGTSPEEDR